jgi:septal ring factor EnvC (AmiA/AmiB activator)
MSPDLRLVAEIALGAIGTLSTLLLRQAVGELRRIAATVESHGKSLAAGNERFRGLDREIERMREDVKALAETVSRIDRDGCARRKECA